MTRLSNGEQALWWFIPTFVGFDKFNPRHFSFTPKHPLSTFITNNHPSLELGATIPSSFTREDVIWFPAGKTLCGKPHRLTGSNQILYLIHHNIN